MRVTIIPHSTELKIILNPNGEVPQEACSSIVPGLFAPWPDAREKGVIEMEVEGETLTALLTELSDRCKQANVDFEPICPITNDLRFDYDVFVNGKNYVALPHGLDAKQRRRRGEGQGRYNGPLLILGVASLRRRGYSP